MGPAALSRLGRRAAALLFQRPCRLCGARVADIAYGAACAGCWAELDARPRPGLALRLPARPALAAAWAAFAYEGPLRDLLRAWKFEGAASLRRPLALRLAQRCAAAALDCDAVLAPPPSPRHWGERGYDPAGDLAAGAARLWGKPLLRPLGWARPRRRQSGLGLAQRRRNAAGAFEARGVKGLRLLLVDDLLGSGATALDAARALRRAGAAGVSLAVLARA